MMRSVSEIRTRVRMFRTRTIEKAIRAALVRTSHNCVHNVPGEFAGLRVQTCAFRTEGHHVLLCDDDVEVESRARNCPHFQIRVVPAEIKREISDFLRSAHPGEVARRYPDLFSLLWVLEDKTNKNWRSALFDGLDTETDPEESAIPTAADGPATLHVTLDCNVLFPDAMVAPHEHADSPTPFIQFQPLVEGE